MEGMLRVRAMQAGSAAGAVKDEACRVREVKCKQHDLQASKFIRAVIRGNRRSATYRHLLHSPEHNIFKRKKVRCVSLRCHSQEHTEDPDEIRIIGKTGVESDNSC